MRKNTSVSLASVMVIATLPWSEYGWWSPDGEFFGKGDYYANVTRRQQGTKHDYRVSVYHRESGNHDISVELIFQDFKLFPVETKTDIESLECAYRDIVAAIADFESSNRFTDEIWAGIVAAQNRRHIFRQSDNGVVEWIASTYQPESHVLGLEGLMIGEEGLGQGTYFVVKLDNAKPEADWRTYQIGDGFAMSKETDDLPDVVRVQLESEVCVV